MGAEQLISYEDARHYILKNNRDESAYCNAASFRKALLNWGITKSFGVDKLDHPKGMIAPSVLPDVARIVGKRYVAPSVDTSTPEGKASYVKQVIEAQNRRAVDVEFDLCVDESSTDDGISYADAGRSAPEDDLAIVLAQPFEQIAQSTDAYPVDFDLAWDWIGYSRKDVAKRKLESDFVEGVDFSAMLRESSGGRRSECIYLSIDCFKQFCMMAGTERGKQVRLYYIDIEKRFKSREYNAITTPPEWAADIMTRLARVSENLGGNLIDVRSDVEVLKTGHEDHEARLRRIEADKQALVIYVAQCTRLGYIKIGYTQRDRVIDRLAEINVQRRVSLKLLHTTWCDDAHRRELDLHDRWAMFRVKPAAAWGREFYRPVKVLVDWLVKEGCKEPVFVEGHRCRNDKKSDENNAQLSIL